MKSREEYIEEISRLEDLRCELKLELIEAENEVSFCEVELAKTKGEFDFLYPKLYKVI